jgi:hypothetical protein
MDSTSVLGSLTNASLVSDQFESCFSTDGVIVGQTNLNSHITAA